MSCNLMCFLFANSAVILCCIYPFVIVNGQHELNYREIVSLGASCYPSDTCSILRTKLEDNLLKKTCECRSSCTKYSTCCIDSPNIHSMRKTTKYSIQSTPDVSCINLGGGNSYYVLAVNKCRRNWTGNSELKTLCETKDSVNLKDPIAVLPVTNRAFSVTYRNYFCALCNGITENELQFWNINITGKKIFEDDTALEQLHYNEEYKQWGFMVGNAPYHTFEAVLLSFYHPVSYDNIQYCHPDLISSCSPAWQDKVIEYKCSAYMGMIYANLHGSRNNVTFSHTARFRNVHCAICNFARLQQEEACYSTVYTSVAIPALSFTLLLDINPSDGDRVGEINRCQRGELYDPFSKKCRVLVCAKSGYKIKNGKCVPT